jgi:DNA-directed RNA polymerase subunit M/transcription elongation factor TFIIS
MNPIRCKLCNSWMHKAKGKQKLKCLGCGHEWAASLREWLTVKYYENLLKKEGE